MAMNEMMFDPTFSNLELGLKEAASRQAIIANNIANADTPGYQAMSFSRALAAAEDQLVVAPAVRSVAEGGSGVVLEDQMAKMAANSLRYTSYVRLLNYKIAVLRKVVTQGRQ